MIRFRGITDITEDNVYLKRWSIPLLFGYEIKLHHILREDSDRCDHDHPWSFLRIVLKGGYYEQCGADHQVRYRGPGHVSFCGPDFRHRILYLPNGTSWSLILTGPRRQKWGFFTRHGWMHWKEFVTAAKTDRVLWCDDGKERGK